MPNPYESAAREKKVARLLMALDAEFGHPVNIGNALYAADNPEMLGQVLARAMVKAASQATIDLLVERIRERDKIAGSRA